MDDEDSADNVLHNMLISKIVLKVLVFQSQERSQSVHDGNNNNNNKHLFNDSALPGIILCLTRLFGESSFNL